MDNPCSLQVVERMGNLKSSFHKNVNNVPPAYISILFVSAQRKTGGHTYLLDNWSNLYQGERSETSLPHEIKETFVQVFKLQAKVSSVKE